MLKVTWTIRQCCILYSLSQKTTFHIYYLATFALTNYLWLSKFSIKNHMKILIFNDTLTFQIYLRRNLVWLFIKSKYMDLTVKEPAVVNPQTNLFLHFYRLFCSNVSFRILGFRQSKLVLYGHSLFISEIFFMLLASMRALQACLDSWAYFRPCMLHPRLVQLIQPKKKSSLAYSLVASIVLPCIFSIKGVFY